MIVPKHSSIFPCTIIPFYGRISVLDVAMYRSICYTVHEVYSVRNVPISVHPLDTQYLCKTDTSSVHAVLMGTAVIRLGRLISSVVLYQRIAHDVYSTKD